MTNEQRKNAQIAYISDKDLFQKQQICRKKLQKLNFMERWDFDGIAQVVKELFAQSENAFVNPPFYCDYGTNIYLGKNCFINYNCTILDVAKVVIGDNAQIAPNVSIFTAGHPIHPVSRNSGYEYGKEIIIGNNVWIGGNTVVCPNVHIGNNVVIGAGSVVTKDIPDWCFAAGNPCRVIRKITKQDRKKLFHEELFDDEAWNDIVSRMEFSEED